MDQWRSKFSGSFSLDRYWPTERSSLVEQFEWFPFFWGRGLFWHSVEFQHAFPVPVSAPEKPRGEKNQQLPLGIVPGAGGSQNCLFVAFLLGEKGNTNTILRK